MNSQQRLPGQSALQAFRSDFVPDGPEATQEDQSAVLAATLLRQSLAAPDDVQASPIREKALEVARESLGETALAEGCTYDDFPATSFSDVIRLLAQRTDRSGRLHLAQHLLESAAEIETDPLASGRILSERARVARKLGFHDLSFEQCQQLHREGRRLQSGELVAKALFGLAALADSRGNNVERLVKLRAGVRVARANGLKRLWANGCLGLGTTSAMKGRYGDAVAHLWKAYELTGGKTFIAQAALSNLGQTLLISGRPVEARKVVTVVLQTSPWGALPATLGTFAIANAQLGDREGVRWAAKQINRYAIGFGDSKEIAESLMECSAALNAIGEKAEAAAMKRRSEDMAVRYGFHGLTFQEALQSVQRIADPPPFSAAAAHAAAAIEEMEVPRFPELAAALPG